MTIIEDDRTRALGERFAEVWHHTHRSRWQVAQICGVDSRTFGRIAGGRIDFIELDSLQLGVADLEREVGIVSDSADIASQIVIDDLVQLSSGRTRGRRSRASTRTNMDAPGNSSSLAETVVPDQRNRPVESPFDLRLSVLERTYILARQNGRCFYCAHLFGSLVWRPKRPNTLLFITWDHVLPRTYGVPNVGNLVAACQLCNGIKGSKVFDSVYEAIVHVQARWLEKGYRVPKEWERTRMPAFAR